ncbi:MAG: FAD-binding oxidoreductase [Chloroflexota bacterium]
MSAPTLNRDIDAGAIGELRQKLRGDLITPSDAAYDQARQAWNGMVDKHPALIVQCADAPDVATVIEFGRSQGLELGVKCGGHSVLGMSIPDGGLMIDLSRMNEVRIEPEARLAHVGGGALLGDLDRASMEHGLATTAGNVSHTGVGGLTLGGGMGWLARQFGMACDNVVEYEIVTASGETLAASADENADLFWGLRGGGGNFGVVTKFTFRLHPIDGQALVVDFFYPIERARDVLRFFREFAAEAPAQATPTAWIGTTREWPFLPPELYFQDLVNAGFVWVGDPEEGRALLPPFRAVAEPVSETVDEMTYVDLQSSNDEPMGNQRGRRYMKGHYLRELSDEVIEAFIGRGGAGDLLPNASLQGYGGAINRVGIDASAFSHRHAKFEFLTFGSWDDPAEDGARMAASRRFGAAMEPFSSGVYVNVLSDEGEAGVRHAYQAESLARLTALKDRYDPDNVFHLNHNITPSHGNRLRADQL